MAIFMPGQVVSIEQFRYHEWDAVEWLKEIDSLRDDDTPALGVWCMTYGEANDIDPRILLTMLEKEQSFVTRRTLSKHRYNWAMGFGVYPDGTHLYTWRGENNVGPEMQIKHAAIRLRELADGKDPHLTPSMGFEFVNGATRALYSYNPSVSGNYNFWAIFHRWFGDGGGTGLEPKPEPTIIEATKEDVAEVAQAACDAHRQGQREIVLHNVHFDLVSSGWCARFVRKCYAAAVRKHDPSFSEFGFGWLARDAWRACIKLREQGYDIPSVASQPGDILGLNVGLTAASHGHMGIDLGDTVAENTSSKSRGPGTVETPKAQLAERISGHYAVFPAGVPHIAIVYPCAEENAQIVPCAPRILSDDKLYVQIDPYTTALGKVGYYRRVQQGSRMTHRYYVKDQAGASNGRAG